MKSSVVLLVLVLLSEAQALLSGRLKARLDRSFSRLLATNTKAFTTLPRLYIPSTTGLSQDVQIKLDRDQAHYVTKVMRIDGKKKNLLRVFDGRNGEWVAQIVVNGRTEVSATCLEQLRAQPSSSNDAWIVFAPLKKPRLKLLLEKCTELGATRFLPIHTERTDAGGSLDLIKLSVQLTEASEQSERLVVPVLSSRVDSVKEADLMTLSDLLQSWEGDRQLLICRERRAAEPILTRLKELETCTNVAFLVGPEGGWSNDEEGLFEEYCSSSDRIHAVSLGSNILRAETAAMTAIAAYQLYMDAQS